MPVKKHILEVTVPQEAIDQMGHVNNVYYLQWVQDVAQSHWISTANASMLRAYAWVALEHHIKYLKPAYLDEQLYIETWVEGFEGIRSIRRTQILRKKDQAVLVTATTQWCFLKMPQAKPHKIPLELINLF